MGRFTNIINIIQNDDDLTNKILYWIKNNNEDCIIKNICKNDKDFRNKIIYWIKENDPFYIIKKWWKNSCNYNYSSLKLLKDLDLPDGYDWEIEESSNYKIRLSYKKIKSNKERQILISAQTDGTPDCCLKVYAFSLEYI